MFQLRQSGPEGGDCTAPYSVVFDPQHYQPNERPTIEEFINHIITNRKDEWGYINIRVENTDLKGSVCYRRGKIEDSKLPWNLAKKRVESVTASGGWTRIDYSISLRAAKNKIEFLESSAVIMDASKYYMSTDDVTLVDLLEAIATSIIGRHGTIKICQDYDERIITLEWKAGMEINFDIPNEWMDAIVQECNATLFWRNCECDFSIILEGKEEEDDTSKG